MAINRELSQFGRLVQIIDNVSIGIGTTSNVSIGFGTITATTFSGSGALLTSIPNSALTNSTISGVSLGSNLFTLTIGTGLSGTSYNSSAAVTIAIDSTVVTLTGSQTLTN